MQRPTTAHSTSKLTRTALVCSLALAFVACSSSGSQRQRIASDLTDEERLEAYMELASRYLELGEVERATKQAEEALKIDPDNERFMLMYGRGRLMRGTRDDVLEAIATFERIPEKNDWRVQATWGAALERLGVFYEEAATDVASGARATEAKDPIARAEELRDEAQQLWEEAERHFVRSVELKTGEPEPLNGLVRVHAQLGKFDESIAWAHKLIEALEVAQASVESELESGSSTAASEAALFRAQRSTSDLRIKTHLHIATLERRRGDLDKALEQLTVITELRPGKAVYHSRRAQIEFEMARYGEARDSIDRFLAIRATSEDSTYESDPDVRRAFEMRERCEELAQR